MAELPQYADPFHAAVWDQSDVERLRNFLMHKTGKRIITRLRLDRPSLPIQGGDDTVAQAARRQEGYEDCISNIFDYLITAPKPEEQSDAFPNLDDNDAWPEHLREIARGAALAEAGKSVGTPNNPAEAQMDAQTRTTEGSK